MAQIKSPARIILEGSGSHAVPAGVTKDLLECDYHASAELARLSHEREMLDLNARRHQGDLRSGKAVSADQVAEWDSLVSRMRQCWINSKEDALNIARAGGLSVENIEEFLVPPTDSDEVAVQTVTVEKRDTREVRDAKFVEIEIAQAVAERLVAWGKIFAIVVAIPLALLALALTIVGVSNWSDFTSKVNQGSAKIDKKIADAATRAGRSQSQLEGKIASAMSRAGAVEGQIADLTDQYGVMQSNYSNDQRILGGKSSELAAKYAQFNDKFKQMSAIQNQFRALDEKVDNLENKLGISGSMLSEFEQYVSTLGFPSKTGKGVNIKVDETVGVNIYWDGKDIVAPPEYLAIPDILYHEYFHKISSEYGQPKFVSEGVELEEAIADFFSMSYLGRADIGRDFVAATIKIKPELAKEWPNGYMRSAKTGKKFQNVSQSASDYEFRGNVEPWLGILWDLRTALGCGELQPKCQDAERLVLETYFETSKTGASGLRKRFGARLIAKLKDSGRAAEANTVGLSMKSKGMQF